MHFLSLGQNEYVSVLNHFCCIYIALLILLHGADSPLSLTITHHCPCLPEKAMAPHSSTSAWKIPWMEGPGRLQSMGSPRVGHNWATSLLLFTFMLWRRKWQPTPVLLPGESQGWGSLVGCHLWGRRVGHDWSDLAAAASQMDLEYRWRSHRAGACYSY